MRLQVARELGVSPHAADVPYEQKKREFSLETVNLPQLSGCFELDFPQMSICFGQMVLTCFDSGQGLSEKTLWAPQQP